MPKVSPAVFIALTSFYPAVVAAQEEEVEEQPTLWGEQRAETQLAGAQRLHVLSDQALQEAPPILAADGDQRSAFKAGDGGRDRLGVADKTSPGGAPA